MERLADSLRSLAETKIEGIKRTDEMVKHGGLRRMGSLMKEAKTKRINVDNICSRCAKTEAVKEVYGYPLCRDCAADVWKPIDRWIKRTAVVNGERVKVYGINPISALKKKLEKERKPYRHPVFDHPWWVKMVTVLGFCKGR
jgi:hypothetical protein